MKRLIVSTWALLICLGSVQAQTITQSALSPTRPSSTVSGLPTCNVAARGQMYIVTDALTPVALATVAGGGAVVVPVICNGTNWIVG